MTRTTRIVMTASALAGLAVAASAQDDEDARPARPAPPAVLVVAPTVPDWLTWGYDQQRTGWNRGETTLDKKNVSKLKLLWSTKVSTPPINTALTTLTSPIVVSGVATTGGSKDMVYVVGIDDTVFGLDAASGAVVWQKTFTNPNTALRKSTVNCGNTEQATPVADKANGVLYLTTGDGKLRGLALADGAEKIAPTQMVAPYSRNWSLNLVGNLVYTAAGRGCGGTKEQPIEPGTVAAMDISDPAHPKLSRFYTGKGRPAGPWGAGGPVLGTQGLYVSTADGPNNPGGGVYGNMILAVRPGASGLNDSFVPPNWRVLNAKDLDLGSGGPVIFSFGARTLAATAAKEGVVYLLDANNLGGFDHTKALYTSTRLGNDDATYWGHGVWGGMTVYQTAAGERWLYVPMWGPPAKDGPKYPLSYGDAPDGSIMAFKIVADGDAVKMDPMWISRDLNPSAPPAVANGVVYALQAAEHTNQHPNNPEGHGRTTDGKPPPTEDELGVYRTSPASTMTLFALDAETGKELWSSKKAMDGQTTHFAEPVVALGKLFVVDHNAHVWAFGLKK